MPNEMDHAEIANILQTVYGWHKDDGAPITIAALQAAADQRRIANGELRPVVHGRWIGHFEDDSIAGPGQVCCSNCGEKFSVSLPGGKYCPSCGALMDESRDGNSLNGERKESENHA